jgi:hypothetical protein
MFVPFCLESLVANNGALTTGTPANLDDAMTDLLAATNEELGGLTYLLHSGSEEPDQVTQVSCEPFVATQRRRMVRG